MKTTAQEMAETLASGSVTTPTPVSVPFNSSIIGIATSHYDGRVYEINDTLAAMLGYTREELLSKAINWRSITPPEYHPLDERALAELTETGRCTPFEKQFFRKDGSRLDVMIGAELLNGQLGKYTCYVMDISAQKQYERKLQESEKRYSLVVDGSRDGVWDWDIHNNQLYWNQRLYELHGLSPTEFSPDYKSFIALVHPDDQQKVEDAINAHLAHDTPYELEIRQRHHSGGYRYFFARGKALRDANGTPIRMSGTTTDITERKRTEERFRWLFQSNLIGVFFANLNGQVHEANDAFLEMIGYSRDDLMAGRITSSRLTPPEYLPSTQQGLEQIKRQHNFKNLEKQYIRKDGSRVDVLMSGTLLEDSCDEAFCFVLDITEQKQAQRALQESEQRFRTLSDAAPVFIWMSDEYGQPNYFNKPWKEFVGKPNDEDLAENRWLEDVHPEDRAYFLHEAKALIQARQDIKVEFRLKGIRDHEYHWMLSIGVPRIAPDGSFTGYIRSCVDITEQKLATQKIERLLEWERSARQILEATNQAMMETEARFRALDELMPFGIWICSPEGQVSYASNSFLNRLGISLEDFQRFGWTAMMRPEEVEALLTKWWQSVYTGEVFSYEPSFRGPDGKPHPILTRGVPVRNAQGDITQWVGINLDISELREVQNALAESEQRFRSMAEASPLIIWMLDEVGACCYINKAWLNFTGRTLDKELGQGWKEVIHPEDLDQGNLAIQKALQQQAPFQVEFRMRRHDGQYHWMMDSANPRYTGDGKFAGYIGSTIDVTEFKLAELAAEEANRRKSQFLASMSHELRTPLNAIIGYSEMMVSGLTGSLTAKQSKYVNNIVISGRHLLDIVNEILDLSKIEAGKLQITPEIVEIQPFIVMLKALFEELVGAKQLSLDFEIEAGINHVYADPARLKQIFINLLSNAVKFTGEGGNIRVKLTRSASEHGWINCEISDTGIGIPQDKLDYIFTEFYQVDNSSSRQHEGTGLGLALTRRLIELHGGTISVVSLENTGTTFTFTLPTG